MASMPHPLFSPVMVSRSAYHHRVYRSLLTYVGVFLLAIATLHGELAITPGAAQPYREPSERSVVNQPPQYRVLTIDGVINPLSARYLIREIRSAQLKGADGLILRLNTPGGLESSMREMTQAILGSSVPVIVYVAPAGARAASAGMFIVLSAHVAAMAPDTTIGAAHPVRLGGGRGGDEPQSGDTKHMQDKMVNDAASFARALAQRWGRNAVWAEDAVRNSVSITAAEALDGRVIDTIADSEALLLQALDGRQLRVQEDTLVRIRAPQSPDALLERPMTLAERILHTITDPNIAYILMSLGILGITIELYSPGLLFPGVTGIIALLLAFISLGSLPISWAGLVLLGLAALMLVLELLVQGFGMLGIGGIVAFILGSLFLYKPVGPVSPTLPDLHVNPWLIASAAIILALTFFGLMRAVLRSQRSTVTSGPQSLIGASGVVDSAVAPHGVVRVDTEVWSARIDPASSDSHLERGDPVEVTGVRGVTLFVRRARPQSPNNPRPLEAS